LETGDDDGAAAYLQRALELRSWHPVSLNLTGVLNVNNGNLTEALEYFDRALKAHPHYSDCLVNRGIALIASGRKDQGLADLRRAGELTSDASVRRRTRLLIARHS
jgi:lipoprotein NlpI